MLRGAIANAIENTTAEYFLSLSRSHGDEVSDATDVKYILNDCGHGRIFRARFREEDGLQRILSYRDIPVALSGYYFQYTLNSFISSPAIVDNIHGNCADYRPRTL
jgi:hypothetical protein